MRNILLIDDEEDFFDLLGAYFEDKPYRLQWSPNTEDALKRVSATHYDAIISDIQMPGLSGIDLFREIKKRKSLVSPFIFLTGFNQIDYNFLLEQGVDKIFDKPIKPEELIEFIETYYKDMEI